MTAMAASSASDKLARFRQLTAAKRLNDDEEGPTPETTNVTARRPRSSSTPPAAATRPTPTPSASTASGTHKYNQQRLSFAGAKSWPRARDSEVYTAVSSVVKFPAQSLRRGDGLNLNEELEREHEHRVKEKASSRGGQKENAHPNSNNLAAMKQIMRRKQMANAARKELDGGASQSKSSQSEELMYDANDDDEHDNPDNNEPEESEDDMMGDNNNASASNIFNNSDSLSLDEKDTSAISAWAMMGNYVNESTLDQADESMAANISPEKWGKLHELHSIANDSHTSGGDGASRASGVSGVLSFLGESPLFDATVTEEDEADRNLTRSAEKVKKLEEHLLRSADGILSPVQKPLREDNNVDDGDMNESREREVTFAIDGGWETPRGISGYSNFAKSPYAGNGTPKSPYYGMGMTPGSKLSESMEAQVNPMNESVIVSDGSDGSDDEEASGDLVSPLKGIGSHDEEDVDSFGTPENDEALSAGSEVNGARKQHGGNKLTPTRASLLERNQTLVKEVRFADQTCVELSERKKYYKNQAGQYKQNFETAAKENTALRTNYGGSMQETAQLKVLVESLQAQKHQADQQVEAYRVQIAESEETHRSSMKAMEKTYESQLKNSEDKIVSLNEWLQQSLATNTSLQTKLDEVHLKWESKLERNDAESKELISSLKEQVVAKDADATMQTSLNNLQDQCGRQRDQLDRERNEREMIEADRDDLQSQCEDLHKQLTEWVQTSDTLGDVFFNENDEVDDGEKISPNRALAEELKDFTPVRQLRLNSSGSNGNVQPRTPTSNLLARTIRSELKRRQSVSDKLERAEEKVSNLKEKMKDMRMDHEEAKADNALLEEDLEDNRARIDELEETLGEKDEKISGLEEEIENLCNQLEGIASTNAGNDAESRGNSSSSRESSPSSQGSSERDTILILEERLDAVEETLEYTDEELTETKARLADTQELLDQTAGELERSEEELADTQQELKEQESEHEEQVGNLLEELEKREDEIRNVTKFSDFQSSTLETMKQKLSKSDTVNAELRMQLRSCFQSLVALEKILRTYEDMDGLVGQKMTEQSRKIGRLLGTLDGFMHERREGVTSSQDLESADEEQSVVASGSESQSVSSSLSPLDVSASGPACARCPHYQDELDELREETAAIQMDRDDANDKLEKARSFIQEFRGELDKQESEHTQETTSLKKQCEELDAKLRAVISELKVCEQENQSLSKTASKVEHGVSQQLSVIRGNNAELIQENEKLRVDLQEWEYKFEDSQALVRSAEETADGHRNDARAAKAAFECLTAECDLSKASLAKLEGEAQSLRELVSQKEREIKDCQESLSMAQAGFKENEDALKSDIHDLQAKILAEEKGRASVEASLDGASRHIAALEGTIKSKEDECQEKENESQELIVHVKQIQNALVESEKEISVSNDTIEKLEQQIKEKQAALFAYEESIISYKDDIRKLDNELKTTVLEKNNRIQMLEQEITSRHTLFSEQLDRTKKERDESTAELTEMIERLQEELQNNNRLHSESGERSKSAMKELEEELLEQNDALKDLEEEIVQKQVSLEEETNKYEGTCKELEGARNEIARITDRLNSFEMDCERMGTKHQDEAEEWSGEMNLLKDEKSQLEVQMHLMRANLEEAEDIRGQQSDEIAWFTAQISSLQKKCNIFKDKVKMLSGKNQAWEDSYKAQSDDLVLHGMEISRLNGEVSDLRSRLIRQGVTSGRSMNRGGEMLPTQTPQSRTQYLNHPGTM